MTLLIALIWTLVAALVAALVIVCLRRQSAHGQLARARSEVRTALMAFTQPGRAAVRPDLDWWLDRVDALERELTPALAENPAVRTALEGVAAAATAQVLPLALAAKSPSSQDSTRLQHLGRLVCVAPTRGSRRALLALQAGGDTGLALRASAAIARRATLFADASAPLACAADLEADVVRSLGVRWALGRVSAADPKRAAVHARDEAASVRRAVMGQLDPRAMRGAPDAGARISTLALPHITDADATVRAAAFDALARAAAPLPHAAIEQGLSDADEAVRAAAARALPGGGREALALLPKIERMDPGAAREVARSLPTPVTPEAEQRATAALSDADPDARRAGALALAMIARSRSSNRLHPDTVAVLLGRLESESSGSVSAALVEALEASGSDRAAAALSTLALRASSEWRLRLNEASTLARRLTGAAASTGSAPASDRARTRR
jgi:hypothetical protein